MNLVLMLQRELWFVEHEHALYRLEESGQIDIALSTLPLSINDPFQNPEQPHVAGRARVTLAGGRGARVELRSVGGTPVVDRCLAWDKTRLQRVEWITKPFPDRWVDANASMLIEGAKRVSIKAYLPATVDASTKTLAIEDEDGSSRREVPLVRDGCTSVVVYDGRRRSGLRVRLSCEPETIEDSSDPRQLGFILVEDSTEVV